MGTPDFALPSLTALLEAGEEVISVYTQPDRPKGRGRKSAPSPVKERALSYHLPVFQPVSLKERTLQDQLAEQKPDLLIVVAYGLILPQTVLNIPTWGAINVHASLLPKYRGAAPIQWAIISGEKETGITTMRLDAGMDTGDILLQEREPIAETDTAQSLHDRLSGTWGTIIDANLELTSRRYSYPPTAGLFPGKLCPSSKKDPGGDPLGSPGRRNRPLDPRSVSLARGLYLSSRKKNAYSPGRI